MRRVMIIFLMFLFLITCCSEKEISKEEYKGYTIILVLQESIWNKETAYFEHLEIRNKDTKNVIYEREIDFRSDILQELKRAKDYIDWLNKMKDQ